MTAPGSSSAPARPPRDEAGIALILTLILTVLLYVLVAELVTTARMTRLTGENDVLLARMLSHQEFVLQQVEEQLRDDLAASAAEGGEGGEGGGAAAALGGLGGGGGDEEGGEAVDSSQDVWFEPNAYSEDDIITNVWVEDENRKFNILTLASPDPEFARESRERFVRLIDALREDSEFDLSTSHGEQFATAILDWIKGGSRSEDLMRPKLKSDGRDTRSEFTIPLHLEELLMLEGITPDIYYDKVLDGRLIPGLESVLTVYTSLKMDPGDPEKLAREARRNQAAANRGARSAADNATSTPAPPPASTPSGDDAAPEQPIGVGIRLNINTMTRPVWRAMFSPAELSDAVIDAILRYRNEEEEEEEGEEGEQIEDGLGSEFGDFQGGAEVKRKIFKAVEDLEQIPEFANLASPQLKERIYKLLSVQSDVFTIHMASMYKRNEERRVYTLRRAKSVVVRIDTGDEPELHPLILLEQSQGMRVKGVDFPDEVDIDDYNYELGEMDEFSAEERRWNPYYLEFYRDYEDGRAR